MPESSTIETDMLRATAEAGYMPVSAYVAEMVKAKEPDDVVAAVLPKPSPFPVFTGGEL